MVEITHQRSAAGPAVVADVIGDHPSGRGQGRVHVTLNPPIERQAVDEQHRGAVTAFVPHHGVVIADAHNRLRDTGKQPLPFACEEIIEDAHRVHGAGPPT